MHRTNSQLASRWLHTTGWRAAAAGLVLMGAALTGQPARAEVLRAGGTGSAHALLKLIGEAFNAADSGTRLEVVPGLGSSGAIDAVADGVLDFAVTGRPLKLDEEFRPVSASLLAHTAFALASSHRNPGSIASGEIADFLVNPKATWPDGVPLRVILRPANEIDSEHLINSFPRLAYALDRLRRRPEIPIASTDQENVALAQTIEGSLTSVSLTQARTEKPDLRFVAIDGVAPTLENVENGSYPYQKAFYIVVPAFSKPAVQRLVAFIRSSQGEKILRDTGCLLASR